MNARKARVIRRAIYGDHAHRPHTYEASNQRTRAVRGKTVPTIIIHTETLTCTGLRREYQMAKRVSRHLVA